MADDREFWIFELKRIYKRSTEAINTDETALAEELASNFNETIKKLGKKYPNNDIVDSTEGIVGVWLNNIEKYHTKREVLSIIRNRSERVAQSLNIELVEYNRKSKDENLENYMLDIDIDATTDISQSVNVRTNIRNQIEATSLDQEIKDEIYRNLDEYWAEFNSNEPDISKMQRLAGIVEEYSPDVAVNIVASALLEGIFTVA